LSFTEDVVKRYESYGWHVQSVEVTDLASVLHAIEEAKKVEDKPSMIKVSKTRTRARGCERIW